MPPDLILTLAYMENQQDIDPYVLHPYAEDANAGHIYVHFMSERRRPHFMEAVEDHG